MQINALTDNFAVAPQLAPEDMVVLAEAGVVRVICNRPDAEVTPAYQADAMETAARAAGMDFVRLPATAQTISPALGEQQRKFIETAGDGKVVAYCASGNRSSILWALGMAPDMRADDILAACQRGGYNQEGLRLILNALHQG